MKVRLVFRILVGEAVAEAHLVDQLGLGAIAIGGNIDVLAVGCITVVIGIEVEDKGPLRRGEAEDLTVEVAAVGAVFVAVGYKGAVVVLCARVQTYAIRFEIAGRLVIVGEHITVVVLHRELGAGAVADADGVLVDAEGLHFGACHEAAVGDLDGLKGGDGRVDWRIRAEGAEGLLFAVAVFRAVFGVGAHVVARVGFQLGQQAGVGLRASVGAHGVVVDGGLLVLAPADAQLEQQSVVVGCHFGAARGGGAADEGGLGGGDGHAVGQVGYGVGVAGGQQHHRGCCHQAEESCGFHIAWILVFVIKHHFVVGFVGVIDRLQDGVFVGVVLVGEADGVDVVVLGEDDARHVVFGEACVA